VVPAADPQLALEIALGGEALPEGLLVTVHADATQWPRWKDSFEALRPRLHALHVQLLPQGVLPLLAPQIGAGSGINLLQGSYAVRRPGLESWRAWRLAAALAAALLALHVAGSTLRWHQLKAQERELDVAIQQTFSQAMPGVVSGGKPRERLEHRLAQLVAATPGRDGLLPMLAAVGSATRGVAGLQLQAADFHQGSLDLKLAAPDAGSVDRISQALTAAGYPTQVQPGAARDKAYEGRLQVRSAAK
jgi:type II secretion system protein L